MTSPGTRPGTSATERPRTTRSTATPRFATLLQGRSFSAAIRAAIKAIQATLIIPSANRAAISAQQQPTHQAPCASPRRSAPPDAVSRALGEEVEGATAAAQAGLLGRRELVEGGGEDRPAGEITPAPIPGEGLDVERPRQVD